MYVRSVARGMLTKTYNKSCADLVASKSQDFMLELSKRTNKNFFKRFEMHLSQLLGIDITTDFTCKWDKIEKCLFKAMSAEQSTVRYAKFLETDYTTFHSLPMELIIDNVEKYIDTTLGKSTTVTIDSKDRSICDFVYNIRKKYDLIFEVARHLNNDFKIIREYIMQLCTKMHDKQIELMDITAFQEHLVGIFETKGVLLQFKNDNIPAQKKQNVSVNETKIKKDKNDKFETVEETPELKKAYQAEIKKFRIDYKEDNAIKNEVDNLALDIGKDPANDDLLVTNHEKIKNLLAKKKKKVCWTCRRQNCLSMQICSRKFKLEKKFMGICDGKPITFKQLKIEKDVKEEKSNPKANESIAKMSPPAISESDSDAEEFNSYINTIKKNNSEEFGFNYVQNIAVFSIDGVITAENLPDYEVMKETELVADKSCIVCQEDYMNLEDLTAHYYDAHIIMFTEEHVDDLEIWQESALAFSCPDTFVPQESYSSGEEQQVSDFETYLGQPSKKKSRSGSSSDSSSSIKSSKSRENKKAKSKGSRDQKSIRTQLISQKSFNENKFKELDSSVKQTTQTTEKILENQLKEEKEKTAIISSLERIDNTLSTMVHSSIAHTENIKSIEDTLASNAKKAKEREEKRKKEGFKNLEIFGHS